MLRMRGKNDLCYWLLHVGEKKCQGKVRWKRQDRPNVVGDYGNQGNTVKYLFGKIARQDELKAWGKCMNICGAPACDTILLMGYFIHQQSCEGGVNDIHLKIWKHCQKVLCPKSLS